jgi:UDP-N-acetylmuramate: L-alanyl-gamma-D-glutamyl-meso-diaminopimelate ligase
MELRAEVGGVCVYDDFAHHPTAIRTTVAGLRHHVGNARVIALLEPRSNTMRMGVHKQQLADSLQGVDELLLFEPPELGWSLQSVADELGGKAHVYDNVDAMVEKLMTIVQPGDHVLVMSNGAFGGIHEHIIEALGKLEN